MSHKDRFLSTPNGEPYILSKSIFIHIPKTGGSFVRRALELSGSLQENGYGHIIPDQIKPPVLFNKQLFCFVRHPLTWLKSLYLYQTKRFENGEDDLAKNCKKLPSVFSIWRQFDSLNVWDSDPNQYLSDVIKYYPGLATKCFRTYATPCQYVGKQESLTDDLISILNEIGEPFNESYIRYEHPKENVSKETKIEWDSDLIEAFMSSNQETLDKYSYDYIPDNL